MSIEREFEGETVTDATIEACKELGISRDELEFDVVQEESSGVLGIGSRKAIIRILNKGEKQENKIDSSINSLDDNLQFDINKASKLNYNGKQNKAQADFYRESILGGANRFTKEVILNPSTAEANRPLWFSSPTGQLLMQFAGYPTVFTLSLIHI